MKVSHFFVSVVFSAIALASSLKIAGTICYYSFFTEDFIERLCENIDKPELLCDDKCELSKMLQQATDKNQTPINIDFLNTETVLFLNSFCTIELLLPVSRSLLDDQYINNYHFGLEDILTPPPQV